MAHYHLIQSDPPYDVLPSAYDNVEDLPAPRTRPSYGVLRQDQPHAVCQWCTTPPLRLPTRAPEPTEPEQHPRRDRRAGPPTLRCPQCGSLGPMRLESGHPTVIELREVSAQDTVAWSTPGYVSRYVCPCGTVWSYTRALAKGEQPD